MSGLILNIKGREEQKEFQVLTTEEPHDWCTSRLRGIWQIEN